MKETIIKFLGGYTKKEVLNLKELHDKKDREISYLIRGKFRAGDSVYAYDKKRFEVNTLYYVLETYNGGEHAYISTNKNSDCRSPSIGINTKLLSFDKPDTCPCCNSVLTTI